VYVSRKLITLQIPVNGPLTSKFLIKYLITAHDYSLFFYMWSLELIYNSFLLQLELLSCIYKSLKI
jgi:hypothetical protein